jgi:hypothetical protein
MKTKCIINKITCDDNIILDTSKGIFTIPIKNGVITTPILDNNKKYKGLINLKVDKTINIKHNNNICLKIILENDYEFLTSDDSDFILTDSE